MINEILERYVGSSGVHVKARFSDVEHTVSLSSDIFRLDIKKNNSALLFCQLLDF